MKVALSVPYCQEMDHIGREKLKVEQERRAEYSVKVPQCKGNYFFFTSHVHSNSWLITKYFYIWYLISSSQYSVRWDSLLYICSSQSPSGGFNQSGEPSTLPPSDFSVILPILQKKELK